MTLLLSEVTYPAWAEFVEGLLRTETVHDLALAAQAHDYKIDRWLEGHRPTEWQVLAMAYYLDWSLGRKRDALKAAGYEPDA